MSESTNPIEDIRKAVETLKNQRMKPVTYVVHPTAECELCGRTAGEHRGQSLDRHFGQGGFLGAWPQ